MSRATAAAPRSNAREAVADRQPTRQSRPMPDCRAATSKPPSPLARQSDRDNYASAATPDSHPDCRLLLIQIAALQLGREEGQAPSGACSETKGLRLGAVE